MKISMKRLGAFVLALVMVFGLIPVMNNAANAVDVTGLTDGTIGVSYTLGNNPSPAAGVTAPTGNSLTIVGGGKLVGSNYMSTANTVTITNNKATKATLSFDFELSGTFGTVAVDGTTYSSATTDSFSKELEAGESITIKVTSKRTAKSTGGNDLTMAITSLSLTAVGVGPVTATFEAPAYGSYTVAYGSTTLNIAAGTVSQSATNEASVSYTLTAAPGEGYKLVGWYDSVSGNYIGTASSLVISFEMAATVRPIIVPENNAVFLVGTNYYTDLNEAVDYAQANNLKQITLVQSGILESKGEDYVIPAGITLLIPMDTNYTPTGSNEFGPAPEFTTEVKTPYAYLTLTLAEGAELVIEGILDVEATQTTAQGSNGARPYGGRPSGAYGAIYMSPNSSIEVADGASVYAWGYIYGQGIMNAREGAKVYELMQVLDFPGGSNMAGFVDSDLAYDFDGDTNPTNDYIKTFPFSQYYVQNIEVELNLYAGATEYIFIAMSAANVSMGMPVQFIGENGMFFAETGVITKKYDPSTDRLEVTVNGDAAMSGITLDMSGTEYESAMLQFLGVSKVDSSTFILTLNSNITIDIVSGTTTVKQDLALLPGVEVYVREGASMVIAQRENAEYDNLTIYGTGGYNVYLWDLETWGKYAFSNKYLVPLSYSPTAGRYTRSYDDLKDVVLCIDGTVIVEGFLYSTVTFDDEAWMPIGGGASVISTGTGKLVLCNGCGIEDLAYCLDGSSSCDHFMFVDSVWLQNGDGSFLKTECGFCNFTDETLEDCQNYGTEYYYCDIHDCWYTTGHGNCTNVVEITWIVNGVAQPMEVTMGTVPVYPVTPSKPADGCVAYVFAGWNTIADSTIMTTLPVATVDAVYFAVFTETTAHVGDLDKDHYCDGDCGAKLSECEDANKDHVCDYAGCKATVTGCIDNNQDHKCDYTGCKATLTGCIDNNQDHKCDYTGCQAVLTVCKDADEDHLCDYVGCQDRMSDNVDNDQDHYCDYAGCGIQMSSCIDANRDHKCDYTGCNKVLSTCKDADNNHYCDYQVNCGKKLSDCEDKNQDHKCDYAGCKKTLSSCEDKNYDHKCDYTGCNNVLSNCVDNNADHKCDFAGCQSNMSECRDDNLDHYCDKAGCGKVLSNCVDANEDHYCDYEGCQDLMSDCEDKDFDHVCDFAGCDKIATVCEDIDENHFCDYIGCGQRVSNCVDENFNHYCDYVGCQGFMSNCEDADEDHYCDYEGCGNVVSTCEDDNFDHYCDYAGCAIEMSSCVDNNKNHKCDYNGCKAVMSSCEDSNEDHKCDYSGCKAVMSNCKDADDNHYCDYAGCGSELSVCEDADNDHYCDHAGCGEELSFCEDTDDDHYCDYEGCQAVMSEHEWVAADCVNNGYCDICGAPGESAKGHGHTEGWEYVDCSEIHEVICKDCYDYSYTEDHTFVNHDCVCSAREFYTLTFMDGQNVFTVGSYPYGSPANFYGMPIPQAPTGYEWDGWYTADGVKIVPGMTLDQDVVCYATWKARSFSLTVYALDGSVLLSTNVPYGVNVYDYIKGLNGGSVSVNEMDQIGELVFTGWMDMNENDIVDGYTMPAEDLEVVSDFAFTGWMKYGYIDGWVYEFLDEIQKTGWTEIDGSWYYLDTETGIRAEGLTRVSYPTAPINGITYAPNMEDVIYANNKGILFLDATTGLFLFDENGKFLPGYTGLVGDSYAVNGYLVWHYGLVEINGNYYYFIGDVNNGGNVMVKGCDYNVGRNTATNRSFVIGGLYTFGADGAMCMYEGITDVNGVLRYYEDAQLMLGNGLTQVGETLIYVNAYGALIVDADYYVGTNSFGVAKGIYYFDTDGFIVIPEAEPGKEGLHFEDGKWYYYVDGAKAYCAGLIEIEGNLVYVKSDGSLATGVYYVTNTNGHANIGTGTKCTFDDNGILIDPFLGAQVLEEGSIRDDFDYRTDIKLNANGKLTIDVSNIWMNSDVDYVGFNVDIYSLNGEDYGEIVRGEGTVEFELPAGEYAVIIYVAWFDEADEDLVGHGKGNLDYKISFIGDGSPLNGIVDGYYYVDGHIAYAAGLIELDGIYYYVRSNGQIVTDCQYWITNVNDTGYEPGLYEFDCDGWMSEIYVETFTGIKDGKFYIEDEVAYAAGLVQYNGGYVYVRSNGEIATGKYWITNHNGLLPEGFYDFGEDGFYYPAIPENAYLLMEVEKNVDTDGFWDYNAIANAVRASADGHIYIEVTDVTFEDELYGQGGFCIDFEGSYWVMQWDEVYKVGTGVVMIPVSADENVILFVNPADINDEGFDWAYGTISYKIWSDVECELVKGSAGE